jgi:hypothetical protein
MIAPSGMIYPFAVFSGAWLAEGIVTAPGEVKVNPWCIGAGLPVLFMTREGNDAPAGVMIWFPALVLFKVIPAVVTAGTCVGTVVGTGVIITVGVTVSGVCDTAGVVATEVGEGVGVAIASCVVGSVVCDAVGVGVTSTVVDVMVGVVSGVAEVVWMVVSFTGRVTWVAVTESVAEGVPDESLPSRVILADGFEAESLDCAKVPAPTSRIPIRKKTSAARCEGRKAHLSIQFVIF